MRDIDIGDKFSYGKIELGVVNDTSNFDNSTESIKSEKVKTALACKMEAVDLLDALRYDPVRKIDGAAYFAIRNALEELADIVKAANISNASSTCGSYKPKNNINPKNRSKKRTGQNKSGGKRR